MERLTLKDFDMCHYCSYGTTCEHHADNQFPVCEERAIYGRLAAIEDILGPDYDLDRLRALMEADRDGLVRIARRPPLESECCGNCGHFRRITGTARGDCAVREYTGKPWRGKFTPCQSRKACRQFQRRTEEHGRSDSEEGRDEAPAAGIPGNPAAGAGE